MTLILWTLAIAVVTAIACAICGVFLVVRREAFISEGLSHSVLPGIIVAFMIFDDRSSPVLILSAGLSGLLMVWLVRVVCQTGRVDQDAALGIVFSGLFSIGIILSNLKIRNVHFHAHCIIDGNLAFAALRPMEIGGLYLGPKAFFVMSSILVALVVFVVCYFKMIKLVSFDQPLAQLLGFRPGLLRFVWLSLVSITAVAAFETAGTVLVVALMITPATTANLMTNRLSTMLWLSGALAALSAAGGIYLGIAMDIAPAGPIASITGCFFLITVLFYPGTGILARKTHRRKQRATTLERLLLQRVERESTTDHQREAWALIGDVAATVAVSQSELNAAVDRCIHRSWLVQQGDQMQLTDAGRSQLQQLSRELAC